MPQDAAHLTEFEYADRLADLILSLQSDVMQPLRCRLSEVVTAIEQIDLATQREFCRQMGEINERLREVREEHDREKKRLSNEGCREEESSNGLIRKYQNLISELREKHLQVQRTLETKGVRVAEATASLADARTNEADIDSVLHEASRIFNRIQELLNGPLANFQLSRFAIHRNLLVLAVIGFAGCFALLGFGAQIEEQVLYIGLSLVAAAGASLILKASMTEHDESLSGLFTYPQARRKVAIEFTKLNEHLLTIEQSMPKRIEKLEFEKRAKIEQLNHILAESKESAERAEARIRSDQSAIEEQHQVRLEVDRKAAREKRDQFIFEFRPLAAGKRRELDDFWHLTRNASAEWSDPIWCHWQPDPSPEFAARIGKLVVEDRALSQAVPELNLKFELPALVPFASGRFLLFEATGNEPLYVAAAQSLMLRALANVPPGKLRFTFIDPVGLGQNVAPFIALGDLDEKLVSGRAWSESQHIEQQLTKLTEHMEMVIQKYLRHDYETLRDYNLAANEIAEPFRFLVICDFPINFNDSAIRRLSSIIQNGPRCGIFTLILRNTTKPMPYGFNFDSELGGFAFKPYHRLVHQRPFSSLLNVSTQSGLDSKATAEVPHEELATEPFENSARQENGLIRTAGNAANADLSFDVVLVSVPAHKKIAVIKAVREIIAGLGLAEAKKLVEETPMVVLKGVSKAESDAARKHLEAAGAKLELKSVGSLEQRFTHEVGSSFDVILVSVPSDKKIAVIKAVREVIVGLGLAEAKKFVEETPIVVLEGASRADSEAARKKLESAGARVELK